MIDFGTMLLASAAAASGTIHLVVRQLCSQPEDVSPRCSRRTELGMAHHIPFGRLVEPDLMTTSYGAFGAMYALEYHDTSVMTDDDRIFHCGRLADAVHKIGRKVADDGWMVHTHELCVEADPLELPAYLPSDGRRVLAESHIEHVQPMRAAFRDFISVTYMPPAARKNALADLLLTGEAEAESASAKARIEFAKGLATIEDSLRRVSRMRRLGEHPDDPARSELLEAIFGIEFDDPQPIVVGSPFEQFDAAGMLAAREFMPAGIRPKLGDKHLRVLSVFDVPGSSNPSMLDAFRRTARPGCRFSTRMVFMESEVAKKLLETKQRQWKGKQKSVLDHATNSSKPNRVADYQAERVDDALFLSGVSPVSWVHFSAQVVFLNDDLDALNESLRDVRKALQGAGFTVNLETMNTLEAYFGHLPFDGAHNAREGLVHSINAGRMWAASSRWHGRKTWNCKFCGPETVPAIVGLTDSGEDFFVDPHDGEDRQSFVALGDSGSGKTTVINAISGEYIREPNDQSFGFDCNGSQFVTCSFLDGIYYQRTQYWLFGGLENPDKRQFLAQFFSWTVELNGRIVEDRKPMLDALKKMLEDDVWNRTFESFLGLLGPYDKERVVQTLSEYSDDGVHRGLLSGKYDPHIGTNQREVHELGHLLGGSSNERLAAPALIWLIKSIEDRLPGKRSMLFFDEAWAGLKASGVAPILEKLLLTIRYRHGGVGMVAQNPDHIVKSPIGRTISAACDTYLLFPNSNIPDRKKDDERDGSIRDFYAFDCNLNDAQIGAIKKGVKKSEFAFKSGGKFGMCRMPLSPAEVAVYGATGADEVAAVKALISDDPTTWRERHLAAHGCTKESARMRSLRMNHHLNPIDIRKAILA